MYTTDKKKMPRIHLQNILENNCPLKTIFHQVKTQHFRVFPLCALSGCHSPPKQTKSRAEPQTAAEKPPNSLL